MKSYLMILFLHELYFWCIEKVITKSQIFSKLFSRSFIAFQFAIKSMIHFEVFFFNVYSVSIFTFFFFFACGCPVVPATFVEKIILLLLNKQPLIHCQRSADYICISLFLCYFIPSIYLSIIQPMALYFIYYNLMMVVVQSLSHVQLL